MLRKSVALLVLLDTLVSPALTYAAGATGVIPGFHAAVPLPSLVTNALPVPRGNSWQGSGYQITQDNSTNQMTVNQSTQSVVIDWDKFNIGAAAAVYFSQKDNTGKAQSSWTALNRIYDANPSLIYGSLKADGKIYLINQNGIIFGPNSTVNAASLVASTFNISNADFFLNRLRFTGESYQSYDPANPVTALSGSSQTAQVVNMGTIATKVGGSVYLVGPVVMNSGTITAPSGMIGLASVLPETSYPVTPQTTGKDPYQILKSSFNYNDNLLLGEDKIPTYFDLIIPDVNDHNLLSGNVQGNLIPYLGKTGGDAENTETGKIIADYGVIGMYGKTVTQNGLVQATTSVKTGGIIELLASDTLTLGPGSVTSCPISSSAETADPSFAYQPGQITLGGFNYRTQSDAPVNSFPAKEIDIQGHVVAPSGIITVAASQRIFLDTGSSVDVSGLWVTEPSSFALAQAQLNSIQLRDDYGQKGGALQGSTVNVNVSQGSSIGNVSDSYTPSLTAMEKSVQGGSIFLGYINKSVTNQYTTQEIVVKQGATLNVAGGGYSYQPGPALTTKLVSGNTVYDISNASEWLSYSGILGQQTETHSKYGVSTTYTGLYLGGGTALNDYAPGYKQGANAGAATLLARQVVLDGALNASATRGPYQNLASNPTNSAGATAALWDTQPQGGSLTIGTQPNILRYKEAGSFDDFMVGEVEITGASTTLPTTFAAGDSLPQEMQGKTILSAGLLNQAGLSTLTIGANTKITVDANAKLALPSFASGTSTTTSGASVTLAARSIDVLGQIVVPGGAVTLIGADNSTGASTAYYQDMYVPLPVEHVFLAAGSKIDVSGDRIDNSQAGGLNVWTGNLNGGTVTISDNTTNGVGVLVQGGATINVDGGYRIGGNGKITGGDAGTINVTGPNVFLDGTLQALSLSGNKGGTLNVTSSQVVVGPGGPSLPEGFNATTVLPNDLRQGFTLSADALAPTGISNLSLKSYGDVMVEAGVTLAPSNAKLAAPSPASAPNLSITGVTSDLIGASSISMAAGLVPAVSSIQSNVTVSGNNAAKVDIPADAAIVTAPGGSVSLTAPNISVAGTVSAPAGSIAATLSYFGDASTGDGKLSVTGSLLARGYDKPITTLVDGQPAGYTALAGGSISLTAAPVATDNTLGEIVLGPNARLDVSGSDPAPYRYTRQDGSIATVTVASQPGSVSLTYMKSLSDLNDDPANLAGALAAHGTLSGLQGGTLTISRANTQAALTVSGADAAKYVADGFDALAFQSNYALAFDGDTSVSVGRHITLDAPLIVGAGTQSIDFSAPWVTVKNSFYPSSVAPQSGTATFSIGKSDPATFIDVTGSVLFSGFGAVSLAAKKDMILTAKDYPAQTLFGFTETKVGLLRTSGDLVLTASRIYPTSQSDFTIESDAGTISILPGEKPSGTIYSAFGNLTIKADLGGIDLKGYVAAPLGTITLEALPPKDSAARGRISLADGSVVTTAGSAAVNIGSLDQDLIWTRNASDGKGDVAVSSAPSKTITINGKEVVTAHGSTVDASGGGSIFTYLFTADAQGSNNPLAGAYVILPDNSVVLPGNSVYLQGDRSLGLKAGVYSLLPAEQYGFVPGAIFVSRLTTPMSSGDTAITQQGYQVVAGYSTVTGTGVTAPYYTGYSLRRGADVLQQGHFDIKQIAAGDAGSISIASTTAALLNGTVATGYLPGYQGGSLSLSAKTVTVLAGSGSNTISDVDFQAPLTNSGLTLNAASVSGQGLAELTLGSLAGTTDLTVKAGAVLTVPSITLAASQSVTLESGATINAIGNTTSGSITVTTGSNGAGSSSAPGKFTAQSGVALHASNSVSITAKTMDYEGTFKVDHGDLSIRGTDKLYLVGDNYSQGEPDAASILYVPERIWGGGSGSFLNATYAAGSDLVLGANVNLAAAGTLTLDAGTVRGQGSANLTATTVTLRNSGSTAGGAGTADAAKTLTVNATDVFFDVGNQASSQTTGIALADFGSVSLTAKHAIIFEGTGAVATPGAMNLTSAVVTMAPYSDNATNPTYRVSNVELDAGAKISIDAQGAAGTSASVGGTLTLKGSGIVDSGVIDIASGNIALIATGSDGIVVNGGAQILARGAAVKTQSNGADPYVYTPGGTVTLDASAAGGVTLAGGSLIDVSSVKEDAGSVSLAAANEVTIAAGTLNGALNGALDAKNLSDLMPYQGGSFTLKAGSLDGRNGSNDLTHLAGILASGGFSRSVDVRVAHGDLTLGTNATLAASKVRLEADDAAAGNILLQGMVQARNYDGTGGTVQVAAQHNLTVTGTVDAAATGAGSAGGSVALNSETGVLALQGGTLDVSGAAGGSGGTVYFRAQRSGSDATASGPANLKLAGTVNGASQIDAELFQVYANTSTINNALITTINNDNSSYLGSSSDPVPFANAGKIGSNLLTNLSGTGWSPQQFQVRPGVEITGTGDITLSQGWDLTTSRYAGAPGALTIRAAGNLSINGNLVDHPSGKITTGAGQQSWGITLVAGADLGAADLLAVNSAQTSTLTIGSGAMVYSEGGPVRFASSGDTVLNSAQKTTYAVNSMYTSVGSYSGNVEGGIGGNLLINGGVIQTATGDIDLTVGKSIQFSDSGSTGYGAIRTAGTAPSANSTEYWSYTGGGDIRIVTGQDVSLVQEPAKAATFNTWDAVTTQSGTYYWSANYAASATKDFNFTQGIAAMGGGNVDVVAGRDFAAQAGAFGVGNLRVMAGRDAFGRFLVSQGNGELNALGNIGLRPAWTINGSYRAYNDQFLMEPVIELDGRNAGSSVRQFRADAQGNLYLGTVMNPTQADEYTLGSTRWASTYAPNTQLSLVALNGDLSIIGQAYFNAPNASNSYPEHFPSTVDLESGGNVTLFRSINLAPSSTGNLTLNARGSLLGEEAVTDTGVWVTLQMSDQSPSDYYVTSSAIKYPSTSSDFENAHGGTFADGAYRSLHLGDDSKVTINAGGNLDMLQVVLPKQATINVGGDISNFYIQTQNNNVTDATTVSAGGDITGVAARNNGSGPSGFYHAGPGDLQIAAGGSINLGNSNGIQEVGAQDNYYLPSQGSNVTVVAGISDIAKIGNVDTFFNDLRSAGVSYSTLLAQGDVAGAQAVVEDARTRLINPIFEGAKAGSGNINMVYSSISTSAGTENLNIIAGGKIEVGRTALNQGGSSNQSNKATGIFSTAGGAINVFAYGDIDVNESRIMTFFGGDLTEWTDTGDINAGRGSKSAVSNRGSTSTTVCDSFGNCRTVTKFVPPAVGSGIRATTYDPNTVPGGDLPVPKPGDIYLFAPKGIIDAGEAGIAGGKIVLGATAVAHAENITAGGQSIGLPGGSEGAVSLGSLSGAGSVAENSKMIEQSSTMGGAKDKAAQQVSEVDDFLAKWLDLKILGFDDDSGPDNGKKKK
ncbi:filamentous haemagglutinin family protein [Geomesophilobacter sediminis]|uniref:Filamentous hemagglutinin family protein n=1 Tax=Geomesophilobacter sediminis TaxID=2798584 RepID=A0A8J7LUX9_9BACT|nr:filamentous haemagglutinin family protein [Geomesophilobacter sediminis]MBJ6724285.1 filamentous hemagglutinin family protein [Geomesophilobacter sediminis]